MRAEDFEPCSVIGQNLLLFGVFPIVVGVESTRLAAPLCPPRHFGPAALRVWRRAVLGRDGKRSRHD